MAIRGTSRGRLPERIASWFRARMRWLLVVLSITACGDNGALPDGAVADAADSPPDADPDCDYREQHDTTNDVTATGTSEQTELTLSARTVVCGTFESSHFDGDITVDVDGFQFATAVDVTVVVRLDGAASGIELAGVDVTAGATRVGAVTWYGDHGVGLVHLAPGSYELVVFALNTTAIAAPVPYRVEIVEDPPQRCMPVTTGGYAEANDGANNTGNNVFDIPSGAPIALTPSSADAAEATGLTVAPGTPTRITGSAADLAVADQYEDRDTYTFQVATGANELSVRLDWTGAANLDVMLFEGTAIVPETRALDPATAAPEQLLYAIKPLTPYQLLIAAKPGATFPVAYTASLCSESHAP